MQSPESWLNHNRYAYCMNNLVMYSDPTGETIKNTNRAYCLRQHARFFSCLEYLKIYYLCELNFMQIQ